MVRTRDVASAGIVALTALASLVLAPRLPAELAVHFDAAGQPDSYFGKPLALAFGPVVAAFVAVLFAAIPRVDPLRENIAAFRRVYDVFAVATVALVAFVHGIVLAFNLGVAFDVGQAVAPAVGVLYLLVAVLLWVAERNWFVGIRTPWTLSDERVWDRTHRLFAPLFALAGVVAFAAVLVPRYATPLLVGPAVAAAAGAWVYSFVAYRRLHAA